MGTMVLDFAEQLFTFLALKYEIAPNAAEEGLSIEEYRWTSEELTIGIARAVMMLSYTYRSSFKRNFKGLRFLLFINKENPKVYATIFAKVTYKCHSPLKILILCSFVAEMYLYIFFRKGAEDVNRHFTGPAMVCFNDIYKSVLSQIDDPIPKWDDVKLSAEIIANGYDTLEPLMKTEHPSETKYFLTSVSEVLMGKGQLSREPEGSSEGLGNAAASAPSTSACKPDDTAGKSKSRNQRRRLVAIKTKQLADQLEQTSLTKRNSPTGEEKSKSGGKKSSSQPLKTKACANPAASGSQAMASTSTANSFQLDRSVLLGSNKTVRTTAIKVPEKDISSSFGAAYEASARVTPFQKELRLDEDHNEANNESPNITTTDETSSKAIVPKAKSKKHKRRARK